MISFETTKKDAVLINRIVKRAMDFCAAHDIAYPVLDCQMDITACHANGNPLKLRELLNAPEFDFCHDIFGIRSSLDRETGRLQDCFVPRYSQPEKPTKTA